MSDASLFIQLYLNEDVSVLVAQLLHPHGFEVLTPGMLTISAVPMQRNCVMRPSTA